MRKSKKLDSKTFALQRRKRRQMVTFMRMIRYGVNNFSRNAWLTTAATAVMTITLLIIFMTITARFTLQSTVEVIRSKVDMSIYVRNTTKDSEIKTIAENLRKLSTVKSVTYVPPDEAREDFAKKKGGDTGTLSALKEATNKFPGTFRINLEDINDTRQLDEFVKSDPTLKKAVDPDRPPSFAGARRSAIQNIASWVSFADKAGLIASVIFIAISSLIVFNTIRMAIFNRKEEIQMMKLIGADRSFIRGPFIVEAVVYGFIAALLATGIGVASLYAVRDKLVSYQIAFDPTINAATTYSALVLLGMIVAGALIGVFSSLIATRKYLKI
jgi:cell division transport system permease protein